jgi:hypothetical protein
MSNVKRFADYAAAFERAFETDDWSEVESYFSEAAVYEVGLPILGAERREGRAAIVAWFKEVLDRFDRRFESRTLTLLEGPREEGSAIWIAGTAIYTAQGVPDLVLRLTETIRFDGEQIVHLEDHYAPGMLEEIARYVEAHGAKLGIEPEGGSGGPREG